MRHDWSLLRRPKFDQLRSEEGVQGQVRNVLDVWDVREVREVWWDLKVLEVVEGHLNPGLFNPKLQPRTSQPHTFQP